jgi:pyruvate/2-oxoglutarate dehydrogenase complex dihydrolipoamide acyltransferase (E2) component
MILRLPDLSGNEGKATIASWQSGENERVSKGQDLVEVVTDKATFDIPSPCDGVLSRILKRAGEEVLAGQDMAEIREDLP